MGKVSKGSGSSLVKRPRVVSKKGGLTLREVTGVQRNKYPIDREEDLSEMVSMVLDGMSYREVAMRLRKKREARGEEYMLTEGMVKADVEMALGEWQAANVGKVEVVIARELAKLADMDRKLAEDFRASHKVDAKSYAALRKIGMSHDEIMGMDFAGDQNIVLARKVLMDQTLKILGVGKGALGDKGTKNYYNFEGMKPEDMLDMVRGLQDRRYAQVTGIEVKDVSGEKVDSGGSVEKEVRDGE